MSNMRITFGANPQSASAHNISAAWQAATQSASNPEITAPEGDPTGGAGPRHE